MQPRMDGPSHPGLLAAVPIILPPHSTINESAEVLVACSLDMAVGTAPTPPARDGEAAQPCGDAIVGGGDVGDQRPSTDVLAGSSSAFTDSVVPSTVGPSSSVCHHALNSQSDKSSQNLRGGPLRSVDSGPVEDYKVSSAVLGDDEAAKQTGQLARSMPATDQSSRGIPPHGQDVVRWFGIGSC